MPPWQLRAQPRQRDASEGRALPTVGLSLQRQLMLRLLMAGLGLLPQQPIWSWPSEHTELDQIAADREPDKASAISRLREIGGHVWLGLRTDIEGLKLVGDVSAEPVHNVLLTLETQGLQMDGQGIWWQERNKRYDSPRTTRGRKKGSLPSEI